MIWTLAGENRFALRQRLNQLSSEFAAEHGTVAIEKIDAEEASASTVLDAVSNLPFLTGAKLVIIKNLSANKQAQEQIEQIISSASDSIQIIIFDPQIDKRTSYFKNLQKKTYFEEFKELGGHELVAWVMQKVKAEGGDISRSDAYYLVERIGANQLLLANELQKLMSHKPQVSRADIDLMCEQTPQSRIFELLDAAFSGNKQEALRVYEQQRAQKVEPQAILAMVTWQLHLLAAAKLGRGRRSAEIARDLNIKPYPLDKAVRLAGSLDDKKLKSLVDDAFSIDLRGKTSSIDMDEALKTYIATM